MVYKNSYNTRADDNEISASKNNDHFLFLADLIPLTM